MRFATKMRIARYRRRLWMFFPGMKSPNRCFTLAFLDSMVFLICLYRVFHWSESCCFLRYTCFLYRPRLGTSRTSMKECAFRFIITYRWFFSESKPLSLQTSSSGIVMSSSKGMNRVIHGDSPGRLCRRE